MRRPVRTVALALFGVVAAVVFSSGVAAKAPVPKQQVEGDRAKLQGKWKVETLKVGGQDVLAGLGPNFNMVVEFQGDRFAATANIGDTVQKTTAKVKYGTGDAKQITTTEMQTVDADGKPIDAQKEEAFGYTFDGDKLLLASGVGKRAADPLKPGPEDVVIVLARVKQK